MTLVPSLRSRSTVQEHTRAVDFAVRIAASSRGDVGDSTALRHVHLSSRSPVSVSHRTLVLASVFGSVGFVALVALVCLLVWYWKNRRDTSEDMILERPTHTLQDSQDPSIYQNAAFSAPIQNSAVFIPAPETSNSPERAYIPDHPYAKSYTRHSIPPTPPPEHITDLLAQPPRLPPLIMPHPYTQTSQQRDERVASVQPSTVYESFMSRESGAPTPEPQVESMEPSPLASTVGGALSYHVAQFDTALSTTLSEEMPSSMSASSSVPLRPGGKQPRR